MTFARLPFAGLLVQALMLAGCAGVPSGPASAAGAGVAVWSSSADASRKLERMADLRLGPRTADDDAVVVDPARRYQQMVGFGAAMTDASALLILRLPAPERDRLMDDLFAPSGLHLSFMRLPIGASDFSTEHYSFDDVPTGETDPALAHFSMARAAPQLAAVKLAMARNPHLVLMASPWSAPGWMKTSDSLIGGSLSPRHYAHFAAYLDRYLAEMARAGLPVSWLSIQNEPHFEPANYPGMRVDPLARAQFTGHFLGPLLVRHRRSAKILDWDHNWSEVDAPRAVLSEPEASRHVAGVAWHCYGGDVSAQGIIHDAFPAKDSFFTECSGGGWAPEWGGTLGWMTDNLIIEATRNWSRGTLLWNLALDENSGPHTGGCGNCRGVVTIDSRNGAITRNAEYYVLGHAARFVKPGAVRIASNEAGGISNAAWRNRDGSIVLIAHNRAQTAASLKVSLGHRGFEAIMPGGEVSTFVWPGR